MYCRSCGSKMGRTDAFCRVCGEAASATGGSGSEAKEQAAGARAYSDLDDRRKGSVPDSAEEEAENSGVWSKKPADSAEFTWNVYDFPRPKKTEDVDFQWDGEEAKKPAMPAESLSAGNADEAFWSELERIVRNTDAVQKDTATISEAELFQEMKESGTRGDTKFFTFTKKNEEFQKLLDREYEKIRGKKPVRPTESLSKEDLEKRRGIDRRTIPVSCEAIAAEAEKGRAEKVSEKSATPAEKPAAAISETPGSEVGAEAFAQEMMPMSFEPKAFEIKAKPMSFEPKAKVSVADGKNSEGGERPGLYATPAKKPAPASDRETGKEILFVTCEDRNRSPEKKSPVVRILLILLILILALEMAAVGVGIFLPDTVVGKAVMSFQGNLIQLIRGEEPASSEVVEEKAEPEKTAESEPAKEEKPVIDTAPAADKAALVASQAEHNVNIRTVRASDTLLFKEGRDYGNTDINQSKPLENNILAKAEDGTVSYVDQELVGALIAYDSQWVDYVNRADRSIFSLLENGSPAAQNAKAFSQVGKVRETFELLEIGEIRQGANGYYVWAHEWIQIENNGASQSKEYYWIYLLKVSNGQVKIADYVKY